MNDIKGVGDGDDEHGGNVVIKLKKHDYIGRTREAWDLSEALGIPRGEPTP